MDLLVVQQRLVDHVLAIHLKTEVSEEERQRSVTALPVMAAPMVCPTAEPTATPPAVAAICAKRPG